MPFETVGVMGAGQMGRGIAQVLAQAGRAVLLGDAREGAVAAGQAAIASGLQRLVQKARLSEEAARQVSARIQPAPQKRAFAPCDLVIEAIVEDVAAKEEALASLGSVLRPDAILATNTSSISITRLARASGRPDRFIGMHFMNPAPVMQLVEVIRGLQTSQETFEAVFETVKDLGKTPVQVNDSPGFASNRILMPMINEAIACVMEGVATPEAVDQVMRLGMNHPLGPLALADLIGLDTCLSILEVLHRDLGEDRYRPSPLLRKMVAAGWLGRKSGRGFYPY